MLQKTRKKLESKFRREDALVKWTVATFFGGILDALAIYAMIMLYYPVTQSLFGIFALATVAIMVLIFYSVIVTHFLPEKRFVSPFASVTVTVALIIGQTLLTLRPPYTDQVGYVLMTTFALIYFMLLAYGADSVAKYIAGLGCEDTHECTVTANIGFSALVRIIDDEEDLRKASSGLVKKRTLHRGEVVIYRNEDSPYRFLLTMAQDSKQPNRTLIHFEAYLVGRYVIHTDDSTKLIFDRDTSFFQKTLHKKHAIDFSPAHYNMLPFRADIDAVILEPTGSRITSLSALPKRTIIVIIAFIALGVIAFVLRQMEQISQSEFVSLLVVSLGPLLVSLVPFVRGPAKRQEWVDV